MGGVIKGSTLEEKVQQLCDHQAIESLLNRYSRGFDRCDIEGAKATFWPDAWDDHPGFCGNAAGMCEQSDEVHRQNWDSTQHYICNNEIDLDGSTAHVESYFFLAARLKDSFEMLLVGGRYLRRVEKRGDEWRIAASVCVLDWSSDANVLESLTKISSVSSRGPDDWVYHRPLQVTRAQFEGQHALLDSE